MGPAPSKESVVSTRSAMAPPPAKKHKSNSVIYNYDRDIPDRVRPHTRHRQIVGENQQVIREIAESCPCQSVPEELEKQFWSQIHRSQAQRDAELERWLQEKRLAREAEAKKADKTAKTPWVDDDPYEYLFVAEEERQRRLLEAREFETPEERVERERQEREDEGRIQIAYKLKEFLFPPDAVM